MSHGQYPPSHHHHQRQPSYNNSSEWSEMIRKVSLAHGEVAATAPPYFDNADSFPQRPGHYHNSHNSDHNGGSGGGRYRGGYNHNADVVDIVHSKSGRHYYDEDEDRHHHHHDHGGGNSSRPPHNNGNYSHRSRNNSEDYDNNYEYSEKKEKSPNITTMRAPKVEGPSCHRDNGMTLSRIVRSIEQNIVAISIGKGLPFATGLVIHPSLVLTARHCVEGCNATELIVRNNFQKQEDGHIDYWTHHEVHGVVEESLDYDYSILLLKVSVMNFRCIKLDLNPDNKQVLNKEDVQKESAVFLHHPYGWTKKVSLHLPLDSDYFLPKAVTHATPFHRNYRGSGGGVYVNSNEEVFALHCLNSQMMEKSGELHTTANYLKGIYPVSRLLSFLYDEQGNYLHMDLSTLNLEAEKLSSLARSAASKAYHKYLEAMKSKPKSFRSANQRYPHSKISLTLHHIIPKSNMEFLWMLAKVCPDIETVLEPLAWSKQVHEISEEGVALMHQLAEKYFTIKGLWDSAIYSIQDSVSQDYIILVSAIDELAKLVGYRLYRNQLLPPNPNEPNFYKETEKRQSELTADDKQTLLYILQHTISSQTIPDHINREKNVVVNSIVWAPWNLFIGPTDRPIGHKLGFDSKEAYEMENTKPQSFHPELWTLLVRLNILIDEAWRDCFGRQILPNKNINQLRQSSSNTEALIQKFVTCLKELYMVYHNCFPVRNVALTLMGHATPLDSNNNTVMANLPAPDSFANTPSKSFKPSFISTRPALQVNAPVNKAAMPSPVKTSNINTNSDTAPSLQTPNTDKAPTLLSPKSLQEQVPSMDAPDSSGDNSAGSGGNGSSSDDQQPAQSLLQHSGNNSSSESSRHVILPPSESASPYKSCKTHEHGDIVHLTKDTDWTTAFKCVLYLGDGFYSGEETEVKSLDSLLQAKNLDAHNNNNANNNYNNNGNGKAAKSPYPNNNKKNYKHESEVNKAIHASFASNHKARSKQSTPSIEEEGEIVEGEDGEQTEEGDNYHKSTKHFNEFAVLMESDNEDNEEDDNNNHNNHNASNKHNQPLPQRQEQDDNEADQDDDDQEEEEEDGDILVNDGGGYQSDSSFKSLASVRSGVGSVRSVNSFKSGRSGKSGKGGATSHRMESSEVLLSGRYTESTRSFKSQFESETASMKLNQGLVHKNDMIHHDLIHSLPYKAMRSNTVYVRMIRTKVSTSPRSLNTGHYGGNRRHAIDELNASGDDEGSEMDDNVSVGSVGSAPDEFRRSWRSKKPRRTGSSNAFHEDGGRHDYRHGGYNGGGGGGGRADFDRHNNYNNNYNNNNNNNNDHYHRRDNNNYNNPNNPNPNATYFERKQRYRYREILESDDSAVDALLLIFSFKDELSEKAKHITVYTSLEEASANSNASTKGAAVFDNSHFVRSIVKLLQKRKLKVVEDSPEAIAAAMLNNYNPNNNNTSMHNNVRFQPEKESVKHVTIEQPAATPTIVHPHTQQDLYAAHQYQLPPLHPAPHTNASHPHDHPTGGVQPAAAEHVQPPPAPLATPPKPQPQHSIPAAAPAAFPEKYEPHQPIVHVVKNKMELAMCTDDDDDNEDYGVVEPVHEHHPIVHHVKNTMELAMKEDDNDEDYGEIEVPHEHQHIVHHTKNTMELAMTLDAVEEDYGELLEGDFLADGESSRSSKRLTNTTPIKPTPTPAVAAPVVPPSSPTPIPVSAKPTDSANKHDDHPAHHRISESTKSNIPFHYEDPSNPGAPVLQPAIFDEVEGASIKYLTHHKSSQSMSSEEDDNERRVRTNVIHTSATPHPSDNTTKNNNNTNQTSNGSNGKKHTEFLEMNSVERVLIFRLLKQINKFIREQNLIGTYKLRTSEKDGEPVFGLMPTPQHFSASNVVSRVNSSDLLSAMDPNNN